MIERIKRIMEQKELSASAFADKMDISRGTISHILSGRNRPSLDVVTRILEVFPEINSDWLLNGHLPMYKKEKAYLEPDLFAENEPEPIEDTAELEYAQEMAVKTPTNAPKDPINQDFIPQFYPSKNIDKIVVFFKDKTYITLKPEE